jgi:hypothetical protein
MYVSSPWQTTQAVQRRHRQQMAKRSIRQGQSRTDVAADALPPVDVVLDAMIDVGVRVGKERLGDVPLVRRQMGRARA